MRRAVAAIVLGIRSGVFTAVPGARMRGGHENCAYCPFDTVCPAGRQRQWERKSAGAAAGPFTPPAQPPAGQEPER